MKDSPSGADPFSPPLKIIDTHSAPAIERNTPVLSPFLRECVILEMRLGRRATEPIEQKFAGTREHVGAVITDAERNVAHQRHAALLRVRFDVAPLLLRDPLHVTEEIQTTRHVRLLLQRKIAQPITSTFDRPMLLRPPVPRAAAFILLDENAEQCVVAQPGGFVFAEPFEFGLSLFVGVSREIRKRLLENALL